MLAGLIDPWGDRPGKYRPEKGSIKTLVPLENLSNLLTSIRAVTLPDSNLLTSIRAVTLPDKNLLTSIRANNLF